MTDEPISLSKKRAERSNDCRDWTVVDALEAALKAAKENPEAYRMVYICCYGNDTAREFGTVYPWFAAGGVKMELSGLLAYHLHKHFEH